MAAEPGNESRPQESFFAPVRASLAAIVALSLVGAITSVVPFIAVAELARSLLPTLSGAAVDTTRVWTIVIIAVAALLVGFAAAFASGMVAHLADAELQLSVRRRLVAHLQRLPLGWFGRRTSGTVRKLVENDVTALHQLVAHAIQDAVTAIAVPVISIGYLLLVQWQLGLAALAPLVAALVLYALMMTGGEDKFTQYDTATARLSEATIEFVHGIAVVKRFGQVGRSHRRYTDKTRDYVQFVARWTGETARLQSITEIITSPVVVLIYLLGIGMLLVRAGAAQAVDLLPALLLGLGLTAPLLTLASSAQFIRSAMKARESLQEFLALAPVAVPDRPRRPAGGGIGVQDVAFSYDGEHRVLHEVTALCEPGTVTALVGASGSGKSTLAALVPRFYDAEEGAVVIGDVDVRELANDDLYRTVGFVFQDVRLLRASVRDNIRLTRPEASQAEVERAARAAQIHDRILRLERGYDTVVGEEAKLSGGEAQRVTIARALLTDAPVLVLDEATAFADPDSEASIQAALSTLTAGRTVLVIAHRLHTITDVDQIVVLDRGRIVEHGRPADLIARGGHYAAMWADYQANHARTLPAGVHR